MLSKMIGDIKKGPWKAEEDEVLINHVKKHGPREWSSIRSKGLLHRTGKSCRLRWVNKLRPNLKSGVKFTVEEERTVIELQAEFGNKWARIATYLPGRTDNDVKNFWSSRQKRLARILQTPVPPKSQKKNREGLVIQDVPTVKAPKLSSSIIKEESSPEILFCSPSDIVDNPKSISMLPLHECYFEQNLQFQVQPQQPALSCEAQRPQLHVEGPELASTEPNFFKVFENGSNSCGSNNQLMYVSSYETEGSYCGNDGWKTNDNPVSPDSLIHNFSLDMFEHLDQLPSPSEWLNYGV